MNGARWACVGAIVMLAGVGLAEPAVWACCPAGPPGSRVVNADQTVILIWDAERKKQHFIRQAAFATEEKDFGFLIPSPNQPELEESQPAASPDRARLTAPEIVTQKRPPEPCGCACMPKSAMIAGAAPDRVTVLDQKKVAGFDAAVLEATSAAVLVAWLKDHGYAYSPEIEAWARPYVEQGWKITALKVDAGAEEPRPGRVNATALRMSFDTERPLFPYREPDYSALQAKLEGQQRLLRIFFIADMGYRGEFSATEPWNAKLAWSGQIPAADKEKLLTALGLPADTGPQTWWLSEFEHYWPYKLAKADVYFAADPSQGPIRRPPQVRYVSSNLPGDATAYALMGLIVLTPAWRHWRKRRQPRA